MFSLFNRDKRIKDIGLLNGATDWHCHILPGVDDGIATMEDSLAALAHFEQMGMKEVWLTPHIMEEMPNTPAELRELFAKLQSRYTGSLQLHLAAENMIDSLFFERLAAGELLPIGPKGDHLLVETGFYMPHMDLKAVLEDIKTAGYQPVLAHPERYSYMDEGDYDLLKAMRVKMQLNLLSLVGAYGKEAQAKAVMLLRKGYYCVFGSDLHFVGHFREYVNKKGLKQDVIELLGYFSNSLGPSFVKK